MLNCPKCNAAIDVDEDDLDEADEFSCDDCGAELLVAGTSPLEIKPAAEKDEDEVEDDDDSDDDDEDEDEGDDDEEEEKW